MPLFQAAAASVATHLVPLYANSSEGVCPHFLLFSPLALLNRIIDLTFLLYRICQVRPGLFP